ncbi:hypothetical protein F4780DRAFT_491252 [Xylariomycetidae sp. FL0641]|nr:hypothetical protein F4780DRAFT_491252 [Xylariomycetidae sp. FL0641]
MSTATFSGQVPINGTIQQQVAPGYQTNIYYILVSNLPFDTSWQQLKDHVRTVCEVGRVEVFNDSTCGWVQVHGRENFDVALRLLSGNLFNGRPVFADGKNATEPIMIKELVCAPANVRVLPRSPPRAPRYTTAPHTPQHTAASAPMMSPVPPAYGESTFPRATAAGVTASELRYAPYSTASTASYIPPETGGYAQYDLADAGYLDQPSTSATPYPLEGTYSQQYPIENYQSDEYGLAAPDSRLTRPDAASHGMVATRKRKIIVRQLQTWTTYGQVRDLVLQKAGSDADKVQHIDLPAANGQGVNRGYALVTLADEDVAKKLIRRLDGLRLDGKTLNVRHTAEGVSDHESVQARSSGSRHSGSRGSHSHAPKEHRESKEKKDRKHSSKANASSSSDKARKSHKSEVVIAHGSTSSSVKKYEDKNKSHGRH